MSIEAICSFVKYQNDFPSYQSFHQASDPILEHYLIIQSYQL